MEPKVWPGTSTGPTTLGRCLCWVRVDGRMHVQEHARLQYTILLTWHLMDYKNRETALAGSAASVKCASAHGTFIPPEVRWSEGF